jgi:hypothetical protein
MDLSHRQCGVAPPPRTDPFQNLAGACQGGRGVAQISMRARLVTNAYVGDISGLVYGIVVLSMAEAIGTSTLEPLLTEDRALASAAPTDT